jgi:hypothetical protein
VSAAAFCGIEPRQHCIIAAMIAPDDIRMGAISSKMSRVLSDKMRWQLAICKHHAKKYRRSCKQQRRYIVIASVLIDAPAAQEPVFFAFFSAFFSFIVFVAGFLVSFFLSSPLLIRISSS